MRQFGLIALKKFPILLCMLLYGLVSSVAAASLSPAKVVQQFIEDHKQGRFAEARSLTLQNANLSASLFGNWLFNSGAGNAATADVFLSRKFSQAFRYTISGTTTNGDNQVRIEALRASPNLVHLYTWALAPKRGATPYEIIEAIDTYLTKVNFPVEQSRMEFLLTREAGEWYISAIRDEGFVQLQQQWLARQPRSTTPPPVAAVAGAPPAAQNISTTTSGNAGRQMADQQFNATLQSFNHTYQPPVADSSQSAPAPERKPSFLSRLTGLFGRKDKTSAKAENPVLQRTLKHIRDALSNYAVSNSNLFPDDTQIYDWQSLQKLVSRHSKEPFPSTEAEAGFSFVNYRVGPNYDDYILLLEFHQPQDGVKRVEVTAYGVEKAG